MNKNKINNSKLTNMKNSIIVSSLSILLKVANRFCIDTT